VKEDMTVDNSVYFEWDVHNWSKVIPLWQEALKDKPYTTALELGSWNGGMSLWLARNYTLDILCTDLSFPERAKKLHDKYDTESKIKYIPLNVLNLDLPDNSFDIVIFKSMLGALQTYEKQVTAMHEIYRVLKPGGVLLFAENIRSTILHMTARKLFAHYGKTWRYMHLRELLHLMNVYKKTRINTAGLSSILLPEKLKGIGSRIDDFLDQNNLMPGIKYIAFGYGVK
jgi:ubiquinone/menaquinone biosynthesis C-methylase UbiE